MNESSQRDVEELLDLCDAVFEGRATDEQVRRLEELVVGNEELRRHYVDYTSQHAALSWLAHEDRVVAPSLASTELAEAEPGAAVRSRGWMVPALMALAACLIVGVAWFGSNAAPRDRSFATLVDSKRGAWTSSSVSTEVGDRLGAGRMKLASGLVTIDFDHGVEVVLEGPAEFELLAADECRLTSGRLIATARPGGENFVVHTEDGRVIDRGTSFGVNAVEGATGVVVFSGRVDMQPTAREELHPLVAGQYAHIKDGEVRPGDLPAEPQLPGRECRQVTSASGLGRDGWVQRGEVEVGKDPETLLLVKKEREGWWGRWMRKAAVTFDLRELDLKGLNEAEFVLHATPTDMGFVSRLPDSTFAVYAILDDSLDDWDADTHDWRSAPGNGYGSMYAADPEVGRLVGRFELKQGQTGPVAIGGPELLDYLRFDENRLVTFLIVCETRPIGLGAAVHGFASGRHPTLPPPTLRLVGGQPVGPLAAAP